MTAAMRCCGELILTACPSVADVAVQPELSRAEVNTVIGAVTKTTMLSASLVRRMVQQLLDAAQVKLSPVPRFLILANGRHDGACSVEDQREGEVLQAALASLETDTETALSDLQTLSQAGNAYASYQLGLYYSSHEMEDGYPAGGAELLQLRRAAGLWPGLWRPGGLCTERAAKESSPGGPVFWVSHIPGGPGRQKVEQKRRGPVGLSGSRTSAAEDRPLLLVVVTLVITLLAGICSPREFAMAVPALVLELGCGVRCVLGLVMDPTAPTALCMPPWLPAGC